MSIDGRGSMSIKGNRSKIAEFGIGIAAVAALALAGCGGGGSSSSTPASGAAADQLLADTIATWRADLASTAEAGTPSVVALAGITSFVATGANSYTGNISAMELATSSSVWSSTATSPNSDTYYLSATGWQLYDYTAASYTNNGNGTISYSALGGLFRGDISAITRTDLSGQAVACTDFKGSFSVGENIGTASSPTIVAAASCPVAVIYPTGSASYTVTRNDTVAEEYNLRDGPTSHTLTDEAGVALSALPSVGAQFCLDASVYDPVPGAAAGADNYHVYPFSYRQSSGPCTADDIATAVKNGGTRTALVSWKATGNAVVPNVLLVREAVGATTYDGIYAFHLGKLMSGSYSPASTSTSTTTLFNKTAANAQLRANGLPPLP